jgi:uncharacterized protein (DUF433 family)
MLFSQSKNPKPPNHADLFAGSFFSSMAGVDGLFRRGYDSKMDYTHLITIEPGKRSGQPCIRGMRITVQDVLEYLAGGMTSEQVLADFPELTAEDLRACLAFAADRERRLRV